MKSMERGREGIVGKRIQQKRLEAGLSVDSLSERTGIPRSTMQNYEAGIRNPPNHVIKVIAAALKTSPAWLADMSDVETDSESLDYIPVPVMGHSEQRAIVAFNIAALEAKRMVLGKLAIIKVEDDLLSPDIPRGADVLINTAITEIEKTDIYAVKDDNGRIMCLWARRVMGKNEFVLYATNDTHFPEVKIDSSNTQIQILGRVCAVASWR